MKPKLSIDKLNNTERRPVAEASMAVIDRLQFVAPEQQVLALCVVFELMAKHLGVKIQDAFAVANNVLNDAMGLSPEFLAVDQYVRREVARC